MSVLVKDLKSGRIEKTGRLLLSNFLPTGIKRTLDDIPDESYVLCVGYSGNGRDDHQIAMSGRKHTNEKTIDGIKRELLEELGLKVNKDFIPYRKERKSFFCHININECSPHECEEEEIRGQDSSERVVLCVYGTEKEILDYFDKVKLGENRDSISKIWACKKEILLEKIDEMTDRGKRPFPDRSKSYYLDLSPEEIIL